MEDISLECDNHQFVGRVYDLAIPIHLGEYDYSVPQGIAPDQSYVVNIERVLSRLVERVESFNVVNKMLTMNHFPMPTRNDSISRTEWLRAVVELLSIRLVSTGDLALILTSKVLELGFDEKHATRSRVLKSLDDAKVKEVLLQLLDSFPELRDERNRIVHWGEQRRLGTTPDKALLFKAVSWTEEWDQPMVGYLKDGTHFDISTEHEKITEGIQQELAEVSRKQIEQINALFSVLSPEFEKRWRTKFNQS